MRHTRNEGRGAGARFSNGFLRPTNKHTLAWLRLPSLCLLLIAFMLPASAEPLESGFQTPPPDARIRAYWWWLNGNVTKAAITRDLEEMAAKGFGGALICDAGGADQWGNAPVPHGPTFFSSEWRELYKHALHEADRLELEISLNIQSGWNLGGPMIKPEDAPKKLVWSETTAQGPGRLETLLQEPSHPPEFYRDVAVVAYRSRERSIDQPRITASSEQASYPVSNAVDGDEGTYWVSSNTTPGNGPTEHRPEWLRFDWPEPVAANHVVLKPRNGYGPRRVEVQTSNGGQEWHTLQEFTMDDGRTCEVNFATSHASHFRLLFSNAFDPRHPDSPRNVQVAEVQWSGPKWASPVPLRRPLEAWAEKSLQKALHFSAPDTSVLMRELPELPGEEDTRSGQVLDLSDRLGADGTLRWDAPEGEWVILRFGCTLNDHCRVSTCSEGWQGYALDPFDANVFRSYWNEVVEPLIADAGPLAGKTLKYLHTDSWEVEAANWTPGLREEFQRRRSYDLLPFLPVIAGKIVDSRPVSNRFLNDFRRTMGDLAIDNHYRLFKEGAHRHGLQIHPESGGPHAVPVDSLQCLGCNDVPMSEFWAWSWEHRIGDPNRFFVKQPASAAHTYGHNLVAAEGFTTIGPHWQERLWDNLKPAFDHACTEGLNLLFWHAFVCSPAEMGVPGQQYFAGTHMNSNVTWWDKSAPFIAYLNRCQFLLRRGLFVADALYYYGDHVPNFAQLRGSDPARLGAGYDYDVITAEAVLTRLQVEDDRLSLPDGTSYRLLVLPERDAISLPVLKKVRDLVLAGATVIMPRPERATSLTGFPESDAQVQRIADQLFGEIKAGGAVERKDGRGRVVSGRTSREVLLGDGVKPDFEFTGGGQNANIDYIHRRDVSEDIYFVSSRSKTPQSIVGTFRVGDRAPELWDAVSGEHRFAAAYSQSEGRTSLPLDLPPCGSVFVVFRQPSASHPATARTNSKDLELLKELDGEWKVAFNPRWGGPALASFDKLVSWTDRPEPGIRFYSGTATYEKTFDLPQPALRTPQPMLFLDLGDVRELAEVKLNGKSLGIVWTPPFRVDITDAARAGSNVLEVEVVNFWPNRIIGDAALPHEQRRTRTNVRQLKANTPLMMSGLLGPVRLMESQSREREKPLSGPSR